MTNTANMEDVKKRLSFELVGNISKKDGPVNTCLSQARLYLARASV